MVSPNFVDDWWWGWWGFLTPSAWGGHFHFTEIVVALVVLLITYWIICRYRHFSLWRRHGIPGPPPSIIFGNLLQIRTKKKDILAVQTEWLEKYGNVCGYFTGYRPTLLVADLEMVKQILIKDFPSFANRARHFLAKKPYSDMIVDQRDERWKFLRRITNPVFSLAKLKMMSGLMQESVDDFLAVVSEHAKTGEDFDVFSVSQRLTMDVIGRCALAMKLDCLMNPQEPLLHLVRRFFKFAIPPLVVVAMVFPDLAPFLRFFRASTAAALVEKAITTNLRDVLARRRANPHLHSVDFLQLFIDASTVTGTVDSSTLEMTDPSSSVDEALIRPQPTEEPHRSVTSPCSAGFSSHVSEHSEVQLGSERKASVSEETRDDEPSSASEKGVSESSHRSYEASGSIQGSKTGGNEHMAVGQTQVHGSCSSSSSSDSSKYVKTSASKSSRNTKTSDSSDETLPKLTDDEIVGNAYMFVLAGYETTANAIAFTCYTLAKHQEWQEKCHREIQEVMGNKSHMTYEDVGRLTVLDRVLQEALRLYPPVPSFVTREAGVTCKIGGVTIPQGVNVTVPVWHIHHHPKLWPQPYLFDPDRFLPERKRDQHPLAYLPFGAGPRNCLGLRFARLEVKMVLGHMLRDYIIELAPSVKDPLPVGVRTVTLNPTEGVWLKVKKRDHSQQVAG